MNLITYYYGPGNVFAIEFTALAKPQLRSRKLQRTSTEKLIRVGENNAPGCKTRVVEISDAGMAAWKE